MGIFLLGALKDASHPSCRGGGWDLHDSKQQWGVGPHDGQCVLC